MSRTIWHPPASGGITYGQHRQTATTTSGGTANAASAADMGAKALHCSGGAALIPLAVEREPSEGTEIRAGEIIAYRAWGLRDGLLQSAYVDYTWTPRFTECADLRW